MNKCKQLLFIAAITFAVSGCTTSSHHASINIDVSKYDSTENRVAEFEKISGIMKEWAKESDMRLVEGNEPFNLSSFNSDPSAQVTEYRFKDKSSANEKMPLQVMVSYNVGGSLQIVRVMFAEGYSKEPSNRLKEISADLNRRLKEFKPVYNIW